MTQTALQTHLVERLEWDSRHLGFPVGRIVSVGGCDALDEALHAARLAGYELVYFADTPGAVVDPAVLDEFHGDRWTTNVTFERSLESGQSRPDSAIDAVCQWESVSAEANSPDLEALALAAGWSSRFRLDPRIPRGRFESLYRTWLERSLRREIAVDVIVLRVGDQPAGLVTVSPVDSAGCAAIGLLAVAEAYRGRGFGSQLVSLAEQSLRDNGAVTARVATQQENIGACRLYSVCGYAPVETRALYHFWPQVSRTRDKS